MKLLLSLMLALTAGFAVLSAPGLAQAQNQSRVAVCDRLYSDRCAIIGLEGTLAVSTSPSGSATQALTAVATSVASASLSRPSPGNLYSFQVTTGAASGYVLLVNAASAPLDGLIAPQQCIAVSANSTVGQAFDIPERFSVGVTVLFSTTGCFTLTKSATAFIRLRAL